MSRAQRRASEARSTFQACKPADLAQASVAADQAGQPGVAELLRQVYSGGLAVAFISDRDLLIATGELNQAARATVLVIGDDDYQSTGPMGWRCTAMIAEWAVAAVIHAAGATAESYGEAAKAARLLGRAVLVETSTAYAFEWAETFKPKRVLMVLPKDGPHPILPPRSARQ